MSAGVRNDWRRLTVKITLLGVDLSETARRVAAEYAATGMVAALIVAGSVGRGRQDSYSDLELDVYWSAPPSDDDRVRVIRSLGGQLQRLWPYEPDEGEWAENYQLFGHDIGISGYVTPWIDDVITRVIEHAVPDVELQMRLSAINDGTVLVGSETVEAWRRRCIPYPESLATATVTDFMRPDRLGSWHQRHALLARADTVMLRKQCVRIPEMILGALCGLNHRFIEHHSFKWFTATIEHFAITPPDLNARLHAACDGDLRTAVTELDRLLNETLDLVSAHLPTVELSPIRAELGQTR